MTAELYSITRPLLARTVPSARGPYALFFHVVIRPHGSESKYGDTFNTYDVLLLNRRNTKKTGHVFTETSITSDVPAAIALLYAEKQE